jgi:hypothetical protein
MAPSLASAQQASYGQYLIVLDDSGSMDESDPRRLVVMAALSFAGALEDGDQIMIAGLNELASENVGPRFVSPRELLAGRDGAEGTHPLARELLARMGSHAGQTPCGPAMERARSILNAMASAGAPQTLLLLTDGACNGGAVAHADAWLGGVRAHSDGRFRFVLLMREGRDRVDPNLAEYARRTGYQGETRVAFDARALLRSFGEVLSFSRGLRHDDGGRVGLERTFAGARAVRILSIHEQGADRIALERVSNGASSRVVGGPTFRDAEHGWSLRATSDAPSDVPYAIRAATSGAEVMVIPIYGRLRIEAVVAPCGDSPALPWNEERAVRAGQPACAWARLVGDPGATIHPTGSFAFSMDVCTDAACGDATAMAASDDGTFHAQLGAEFPLGRHERSFRASGGGLAHAIDLRRGFSAVSFGIHRVALASEPARPIEEVDLGVLPKPTADQIALTISGAFPAGSHARIACEVEGACVECIPENDRLALTDPFNVQLTVRASAFCPAVSEGDGRDLPVRMRVLVRPDAEVPEHAIPILARLSYARAQPVVIEVEGGERAEHPVVVPAPIAQGEVRARIELDEGDLIAGAVRERQRMRAGDERTAPLALFAEAEDCCGAGDHEGTLVLSAQHGPELRLPLTVRVIDPGFWICPGKQILMWALIALGVLLLGWIVHGLITPASFRDGTLILWASSYEALLRLRDGDEGYRKLERFVETKRGFRRPGTLYLGGPKAPLPSLKRLPDDARIEATDGGGARLVVKGPGVEKWNESDGWTELAPGEYPVSNRITLRRGEETYLSFRR